MLSMIGMISVGMAELLWEHFPFAVFCTCMTSGSAFTDRQTTGDWEMLQRWSCTCAQTALLPYFVLVFTSLTYHNWTVHRGLNFTAFNVALAGLFRINNDDFKSRLCRQKHLEALSAF